MGGGHFNDGSHDDTRLPFPRGMSATEFGTGEGPGTKSSAEGVKMEEMNHNNVLTCSY